MAQRKEVFQSKVLQKLYPAAPKVENQSSAAQTKKTIPKKTTQDAFGIGNTSTPSKRVYTVLPPPADYKTDAEESVMHYQLEDLKGVEDPAEESGQESSDAPDQAKETEERKRRRKRKKRKDVAPTSETSTGVNQTAAHEGAECLSKNKKRKLKKKRHKERLLSMGLMPRAAALEFTYQREEVQQQDEDERKAA